MWSEATAAIKGEHGPEVLDLWVNIFLKVWTAHRLLVNRATCLREPVSYLLGIISKLVVVFQFLQVE